MHHWPLLRKSLALVGLFAIGGLVVGVVFPICGLLYRRRRQVTCNAITMAWCRAVCRVLGIHIHMAQNAYQQVQHMLGLAASNSDTRFAAHESSVIEITQSSNCSKA